MPINDTNQHNDPQKQSITHVCRDPTGIWLVNDSKNVEGNDNLDYQQGKGV